MEADLKEEVYSPVTIISEDEYGRIGNEEHFALTLEEIKVRCRELSERGWEPTEIQVDESQYTLPVDWG